MGNVVVSNPFVQWVIERIRNRFNAGHEVRLFNNPLTPTPSTPLAAFSEATFAGYTPRSLVASFPAAVRPRDGEYQITPSPVRWIPTADDPQIIYGWYVVGLGIVCMSGNFAPPQAVVNGSEIDVITAFQTWGLDVLCP